MADAMVEKTQRYLNAIYGNDSRFKIIPDSQYGKTGWTTIYALIRALQIELGIQNTADSFGPTTIAKFNSRFPNGIVQQSADDESSDRIYAIIQGGCWCKGYSTGASGITEHFYGGTGGAIQNLKNDAGMLDTTSTVTINVMKALLSMDQFKLVPGGNIKIRQIQQKLNKKYEDYIGLCPCDGLYGRQMNKSLIIALQKIEGYSKEDATGNFGAGTKANLPILPNSGQLSEQKEKDAIEIMLYALCCNGVSEVNIDVTVWNPTITMQILQFQKTMLLPDTGICDTNTWMSLLTSKGNPDRSCVACDTRFEMTEDRLQYLKENGYQIVGRYLTGGDFKELRVGEPQRILDAGLKLFLIFQESGTDLSYFTVSRGKQDAIKAAKAARKHGIEGDNHIYFAVDTDPTDPQIASYILPYFKAISENLPKAFKVGIYSTRNACTQVIKAGYANTCFVSDMSTGFSGNMGLKMPIGWNLDQFHEIRGISTGSSEPMELDKVAYSGMYHVVNKTYKKILEFNEYIKELELLYREYKKECSRMTLIIGITNFLRSFKYADLKFYSATLRKIDYEFVNFVKTKNLNLYNNLAEYANSDSKALYDRYGGYIDIGHLAATAEGYITVTTVPKYWLGWAGDLATLMNDLDTQYGNGEKTHLELARSLIGNRSSFGYADICTDADSIKIAQMLIDDTSVNSFSSAIDKYYSDVYSATRLSYYLLDLNTNFNVTDLKKAIEDKMTEGFVNSIITNILGKIPSTKAKEAGYEAFAEYIVNT